MMNPIRYFFLVMLIAPTASQLMGLRNDKTTPDGTRIVGGVVAEKGRYPYQVGLLKNSTSTHPFCGGTLIAPNWVLSAAHCYGLAYYVVIGRHNWDDDEENYEVIAVEEEIKHPDYSTFSDGNDVMLIRLVENSRYDTVQVDDGSVELNRNVDLTVMGWGATQSEGQISKELREVEVDYYSQFRCNLAYLVYFGITSTAFCAGRFCKDSCQGDSGGPIIIKGEDASKDVQVGIVSWGIGCANPLFPGVYSRVGKFNDFISSYITSE